MQTVSRRQVETGIEGVEEPLPQGNEGPDPWTGGAINSWRGSHGESRSQRRGLSIGQRVQR
jgi:hypothetical protein